MHDHQLRVHNLPRDVDERRFDGQRGHRDRSAAGDLDDLPGAGVGCARSRAVPGSRGRTCGGGQRRSGMKSCWAASGRAANRRVRSGQFAVRIHARRRWRASGVHYHDERHAGTASCAAGGSRDCRRRFVNLSAVVASVKDEPRIDILCAGTDGQRDARRYPGGGRDCARTLSDAVDARAATERRGSDGTAGMELVSGKVGSEQAAR